MIYAALSRTVEAMLRLRASLGGGAVLRERLVLDNAPGPARLWVHGASIGELASAREVILALAARMPVLVTANTVTGRDLARDWDLPARLAPLDLPGALARFLDAAQPAAQLTLEGEFWPLRSRLLAERGIPQAMIGARMSERSARRWARLPGLIGPVLGRIAALSAQDAGSQARLLDLGLPRPVLLPPMDLKLLTPARVVPAADSPARDRTVLAASTHEGEEEAILDAWQAARRQVPDLRLILAIRHPRRGDEVAALLTRRGLPVARRSTGADGADPVLIVDLLGEMPRWYAAAGICFVGGSLADRGGHTPWEPAAHRCAILHGPHVSNFTDAYAALAEAGAAERVGTGALPERLAALAGDPAAARAIGHAARGVLDARAGDPARLIALLSDLADPAARHDIKKIPPEDER